MSDYKGRKFDLSKGGIHASNPPKGWWLCLCKECKSMFEHPKEVEICDDCKEILDIRKFSYRIFKCSKCDEEWLQGNDSNYSCIYCENKDTIILKEGEIELKEVAE